MRLRVLTILYITSYTRSLSIINDIAHDKALSSKGSVPGAPSCRVTVCWKKSRRGGLRLCLLREPLRKCFSAARTQSEEMPMDGRPAMRPCAPVFEPHGQIDQASPAPRNEENALPALALNACDPLALSGAHVYREVSSPTFRHSGRPAWIPPCTRSRRPLRSV